MSCRDVGLEAPFVWRCQTPNLLTVRLRIRTKNGAVGSRVSVLLKDSPNRQRERKVSGRVSILRSMSPSSIRRSPTSVYGYPSSALVLILDEYRICAIQTLAITRNLRTRHRTDILSFPCAPTPPQTHTVLPVQRLPNNSIKASLEDGRIRVTVPCPVTTNRNGVIVPVSLGAIEVGARALPQQALADARVWR